ncbi:MAG: hypothetical protein IT244_04275 [Bacteroidia bacterium]|nr:hypothetical protein [Bacteroidia bacterium]
MMETTSKNEFLKSKWMKFLLPLAAAVLIIAIFQNGYDFGQWLHKVLNK